MKNTGISLKLQKPLV